MPNFLQVQQKAIKLTPEKVRKDLFKFIRSLESYLAELNRKQIHEKSQDVNGNPLGFYSPATEFITTNNLLLGKGGKIKKAGDPYDLKDTGDFLNNLFVKVDSDSVFFDTKDPKKQKVLKNLLSDDLFGLSDKELKKVIDKKISPFLLQYYKNNLL
ncbi:hypothetical protein ACFSTE_15775 [Aquimarina hainanensis]|uniref:Uncharacterized protein n=1 Tax=Aquimarina hainanensis TaxID=1578017 RepID=A0ABW5N9J6_9FLAO